MSYIARITQERNTNSPVVDMAMSIINNRLQDPNITKVAEQTLRGYRESTKLPAIITIENEGDSILDL